jgi:hypothetical protein
MPDQPAHGAQPAFAQIEFMRFFVKCKEDGTLRTRAERIATLQAGIDQSKAEGHTRDNALTAVQLEAMLFPDAPPNTDQN